MPGFELIGNEELAEVEHVFKESRILFRHSFDPLRNGIYKVKEFEEAFSQRMNTAEALAVTSGSAALRVALAGLGIGPGDEVITQAFTFVATVEAIIEAGAQPIIAEIDNTLNMDPEDLVRRITPRTKAVIVVHMLGIPCRMEPLLKIAREHNLSLIEDTAWGCGGTWNGQALGTIGDIGTYSFDFAKTMTTGEGGIIVCKSKEVAARCRAYHDHGHENNPAVPRWEDTRSGSGFNYRMMELQGAIGLAQLKKLDTVIEGQRQNKQKIRQVIQEFSKITFRAQPEHSEETADALVFETPSPETARRCLDALIQNGLGTKILPEAITWHFAGTWDHMPSLVQAYPSLINAFPESLARLSRSVALPITVNMAQDIPDKIGHVLEPILK